jgi:hypothetical protein
MLLLLLFLLGTAVTAASASVSATPLPHHRLASSSTLPTRCTHKHTHCRPARGLTHRYRHTDTRTTLLSPFKLSFTRQFLPAARRRPDSVLCSSCFIVLFEFQTRHHLPHLPRLPPPATPALSHSSTVTKTSLPLSLDNVSAASHLNHAPFVLARMSTPARYLVRRYG